MVAADFLNYINDFQVTSSIGLEDFADRYNNIYSVMCIFLCMIIISMKEYFMDPLTCYIATPMDGKALDSYVDDYCWVRGTYALSVEEEMPESDEQWAKLEHRRIYYYQWVPVVLGMQCIMFMLIRILWQIITFNRIGTDLQRLVNVAQEAGQLASDERDGKIGHVVKVLEEIIFKHRDFRKGRLNEIKRRFGGVLPSKRLGNQLSGFYIIMKFVCIANNLGQIFLIQHFLGLEKHYKFFGIQLLRDIAQGRDWKQTLVFPRVTFCRPELKHLGVNNKLVAQCALPVNMLNEKIYIFLWFWMVLGVMVTLFSVTQWLYRINMARSQGHFVRRYLRVKNEFKRKDRELIKMFVQEFLRRDGIFVLKMLSINVGDLTTSDIVTKLWQLYKEKYSNQDMARGNTNEDDGPSGGENGVPMEKTPV